MSPAVTTALEVQGTRELSTSKSYLAMAYWCENQNWNGFAKLFHLQANEEQAHGRKFFHFLVDRGEMPSIGGVGAPRVKFENLTEVAKAAFDLERANTAAIHAAYEVALAEKDYATQVFLQEFIAEQVEEEAWTDTLLDKVRQAVCAGAIFNLDRHVVKEVLGDAAEAT
jgi:ferritin